MGSAAAAAVVDTVATMVAVATVVAVVAAVASWKAAAVTAVGAAEAGVGDRRTERPGVGTAWNSSCWVEKKEISIIFFCYFFFIRSNKLRAPNRNFSNRLTVVMDLIMNF